MVDIPLERQASCQGFETKSLNFLVIFSGQDRSATEARGTCTRPDQYELVQSRPWPGARATFRPDAARDERWVAPAVSGSSPVVPAEDTGVRGTYPALKHFARRLEQPRFDILFMAGQLAVLNMPTEALKRSATVTSSDPLTRKRGLERGHHGKPGRDVEFRRLTTWPTASATSTRASSSRW
jgi:hypothetical protein